MGDAEEFGAEATGALQGLSFALRTLRLCVDPSSVGIHLCIDISSVIGCLRGTPAPLSQREFRRFKKLAAAAPGQLSTHWSPGHMGIEGNEEADKLANEAYILPLPAGAQSTLSAVRRTVRERSNKAFQDWWSANTPDPYKPLGLTAKIATPPELNAPRGILRRLLAARSGHGDFCEYHLRFSHDDAKLQSCIADAALPRPLGTSFNARVPRAGN